MLLLSLPPSLYPARPPCPPSLSTSDAFQLLGMAERGFLPEAFTYRSKHGTPLLGILASASGVILLSWMTFQEVRERGMRGKGEGEVEKEEGEYAYISMYGENEQERGGGEGDGRVRGWG